MSNVDDFLQHYGVLGMKWGVRRSQRALDAASKTKTKASPKLKAKPKAEVKRKAPPSEDFVNARALQRKKSNTLSNSEMQELVTRMNLEQQYSRLNPSKFKKGMAATKVMTETLNTVFSAGLAISKIPSVTTMDKQFTKAKSQFKEDLNTVKKKKKTTD